MTRLCALIAVVGTTGCFYTDTINQRPSIDIQASGDEVYRGDHVEFGAIANDPEHHYVSFDWRAYACTDGAGGADCDVEPFYTQHALDHADFMVPFDRTDVALPTRNVRVVLEAKDELGATAKPAQEHIIVALDRPPEVVLARNGSYVMTPTREVILFATVSDVDDGPVALGEPDWKVFAPSQLAYTLVDEPVTQNPMDTKHRTYAKRFTPSGTGDWEIQVTATDPLDKATTSSLTLPVVTPPPPCLAQLHPIVPPAGAHLPITDPTLFRVPVVIDDRDVYPPQPDDPALGVARFQWSFMGPTGGTHANVAGATSNTFELDPSTFTPGDIVEVRVEIFDRQNTPIPCPDGDATCSTISQATCLQRQTWSVEIR